MIFTSLDNDFTGYKQFGCSKLQLQPIIALPSKTISPTWEERLAAYVRSSFAATMLAAKGQNVIQYVSKVTNTALLLFGAQAVINGELQWARSLPST